MRILTGICVSACLTLALTGCAKKGSIEACPEPAVDCPPVATTAATPAYTTKLETAARLIPATPIDQTPSRDEAETAAAPEAGSDEEYSADYENQYARNRGEGTADWAVALEDMPEYLESIGAAEQAAEPAAEAAPLLMASARTEPLTPADSLDGAFGADENGDPVPATVLVPGAVTAAEIDFPEEPATPDDFGLQPEEIEQLELPEQITQPEPTAEPTAEPSIEPAAKIPAEPVSAKEAEEPEAAEEDDPFSFDTLGLSLDPLPAEEPLTETKAEKETAEAETVDPLLPTEDDLDFFGSLSDSFFNEQSDGKSDLEG